jgi:hypothetical protein
MAPFEKGTDPQWNSWLHYASGSGGRNSLVQATQQHPSAPASPASISLFSRNFISGINHLYRFYDFPFSTLAQGNML